jgi:hypothetical protein
MKTKKISRKVSKRDFYLVDMGKVADLIQNNLDHCAPIQSHCHPKRKISIKKIDSVWILLFFGSKEFSLFYRELLSLSGRVLENTSKAKKDYRFAP